MTDVACILSVAGHEKESGLTQDQAAKGWVRYER